MGIVRVAFAFAGTIAMFAFWVVLIVIVPMTIALYLSKLLPLVGRRGRESAKRR